MGNRIVRNHEDPMRQYLEAIVSYYSVPMNIPEFSGFLTRQHWLNEHAKGDYYIVNRLMIHPLLDENIYFTLLEDAVNYNSEFGNKAVTSIYEEIESL